jgi:hypothetical protein
MQGQENLDVVERVAPATNDRQEFSVSVEPFGRDVKPVGNLRLEIAYWLSLPCRGRWRFLALCLHAARATP